MDDSTNSIPHSFEYDPQAYNTQAASILLPLVFDLIKPQSMLDVGCGLGTWLTVGDKLGANDYLGVEGHVISSDELVIPSEKLLLHDLRNHFDLGRQFDLVISLEVAEHLPESAAETFVASLVRHGEAILFSAAIPNQGGQNHLNEQWPKYWMEHFSKHGYVFYDVIRPKVWDDDRVDFWYRQNIFLVLHDSLEVDWEPFDGKAIVHPAQWLDTLKWLEQDKGELEKERRQWENQSAWLSKVLSEWKSGQRSPREYWKLLKKALKRKFFR